MAKKKQPSLVDQLNRFKQKRDQYFRNDYQKGYINFAASDGAVAVSPIETEVRRSAEALRQKNIERQKIAEALLFVKSGKGETSNELLRRARQHETIWYDEWSDEWHGCGNTDLDEFFAQAKGACEQWCQSKLDEIASSIRHIRDALQIQVLLKDKLIIKKEPMPASLAMSKRVWIGSILRPSVYFLYRDDEIIYIGQSLSPYTRIKTHTKDKNFNSFRVLACRKERMTYWERVLIQRYHPALNRTHNTYSSEAAYESAKKAHKIKQQGQIS